MKLVAIETTRRRLASIRVRLAAVSPRSMRRAKATSWSALSSDTRVISQGSGAQGLLALSLSPLPVAAARSVAPSCLVAPSARHRWCQRRLAGAAALLRAPTHGDPDMRPCAVRPEVDRRPLETGPAVPGGRQRHREARDRVRCRLSRPSEALLPPTGNRLAPHALCHLPLRPWGSSACRPLQPPGFARARRPWATLAKRHEGPAAGGLGSGEARGRPRSSPLKGVAWAAAVPLLPEMMAPAWPICLPAGALKPAR